MRSLLAVLIPVTLSAQIVVDTVVHLPSFVINGRFIPELNKLYVLGWYEHYALDCSTWELRGQIPRSWNQGLADYSWNWRRQKMYIAVNPNPDSLVVIDGAADTLIRTLMWSGFGSAYVSSTDRLYRPVADSFGAIDCASDTPVRGFRSPVSGYGFLSPSWDSVDGKLYVSLSSWGSRTKLAAYDCSNDSLRAIIDIPGTYHTTPLAFDYQLGKAYYTLGGMGGYPGVIDTRGDTLIREFPFLAGTPFGNGIALDTLDQKAYILGAETLSHYSALYVIDCVTDSVIKKITFPHAPWPVDIVRWVPWSNRVYLSRGQASSHQDIGMYVVDCNTDSIIVSNLVLGYYPPFEFQLDPIRERVFAIGCESTSVHVLRDVEAGVAEEPAPRPAATATARFCPSSSGVLVEYQLPAAAHVRASLHDAVGRRIGRLDAGEQKAGLHQLSWNRDQEGRRLSAGTYFVRLNLGAEQARLKAVLR